MTTTDLVQKARDTMRRSLITRQNTIRTGHPVRNEVCDLSSGNYYEQFHHFTTKLREVLRKWGLMTYGVLETPYQSECLQRLISYQKGHITSPLIEVDGGTYPPTVGILWVSWYRMPSGNWEITTYIS